VVAALAVALLAGQGCAELPSITGGVCGNLVVDASEDCDGFSVFAGDTVCAAPTAENACHYLCSEDASCPEGWGCGADGRCRRPSGRFEPAPESPWRFNVNELAVGDVDGDRHDDLLGNNEFSLAVRFGSSSATFLEELEVNIRPPTGPLTFARFDGDPLLDVLVPTESGLFALLGQPEREFDVVSYAQFEVGTGPARVVPVESDSGNITSEVLTIGGGIMAFAGHTLGVVSPLCQDTRALGIRVVRANELA
jgi:hypothetical protein